MLIKRADNYDVIVVGGGLSGMHAAVEANKKGAKVAIISKKKAGKSGASVVSKSIHRFAPKDPSFKIDFTNKALEAGRFINDKALMEILINNGSDSVENLLSYLPSLYFNKKSLEDMLYSNIAYHNPKKGVFLTSKIREYIERHTSISIFDNFMGVEIMTKNNSVCGLITENKNDLHYFTAKCIVLATGGYAYIYRETSTTNDATGDGIAMALRKGLPLTDMEFVQFYPYRVISPAIHDIFPNLFSEGAIFLNEKNERFMQDFPKKELENRDVLAREIFKQKEVFLNLDNCSIPYLTKESPELLEIQKKYPETPLKVVPKAHFSMGGIRINPDCSTGLRGLYACAEVTGGLHGANRLAGYALTETAVFGPVAGKNAALYAESREYEDIIPEAPFLPQIGRDDIKVIKHQLRDVMWEKAGIVKNEEGLLAAHSIILEMKTKLEQSKPAILKDWIETYNMLSLAFVMTESSLLRKESRGAHFRSDYPDENNKFLGNFVYTGFDMDFNKL
ncbi:MAG: FAD-binding protein [Dethiosulfatibacter sp.]|nr:FAD-binding protein [Dethiosulfatibacter sp.]